MKKTAIAIRHIAFEDLGSFEQTLKDWGYDVHYYDVGLDDLASIGITDPDLLIVLGGPIGAYEEDRYPFLATELTLIGERLNAGRPIIGICLGAQIVARALGARVYPGQAKEFGFAPITLTVEGQNSCLAALSGHPVLHWHGDTFDLPEGAVRLASTEIYQNQAFAFGQSVLAMQFHPEASDTGFERWLIGHTGELAALGLNLDRLRNEALIVGPKLREYATECLSRWLTALQICVDRDGNS